MLKEENLICQSYIQQLHHLNFHAMGRNHDEKSQLWSQHVYPVCIRLPLNRLTDGESAFDELGEIFYIVQPNNIF